MYLVRRMCILVLFRLLIKCVLADCPDTQWLLNNGICYYADPTVSISWNDAVQFCINRDSLLVYPKTITEKDFVFSIFSSKGIGSSWIGLDDKLLEGTYIWQDGTQLQPSQEGWIPGRPDNTVDAEDCIELWPEGWNDATCGWAKNAICQVPEHADAVETTTSEAPTTTELHTTTNTVDICSVNQGSISNQKTYYRRDYPCQNGFLTTSTYTKSILRCGVTCAHHEGCCAFSFNANGDCVSLHNSAGGYIRALYFTKC